ncbi:MAG: hypothetical protein JW797_12645 [Bradymonadales bacterium]|nr:hypothetical protein [Bradymonadales bacterium]
MPLVLLIVSWLPGIGCAPQAATVRGPAVLGLAVTLPMEKSSAVAEVQGELSQRDGLRPEGQYMDTFVFFGRGMEVVQIRLESEEIDSYLLLLDGAGALLAEDDDSGGGLNSRIDLVLPVDGLYLAVASSYGRQVGGYRLRVVRHLPTAEYRLLHWPAVLEERFDAEGPGDKEGRPFAVWALDLTSGQTVSIRMSSTAVIPLLWLYDVEGREVAAGLDPGEEGVAALGFTCAANGLYFLVATTYAQLTAGQSAPFRLCIE